MTYKNQYYYFCTEDEEIVQVPNLPVVQYGLVKGDLLVVLASPYKKNKTSSSSKDVIQRVTTLVHGSPCPLAFFVTSLA